MTKNQGFEILEKTIAINHFRLSTINPNSPLLDLVKVEGEKVLCLDSDFRRQYRQENVIDRYKVYTHDLEKAIIDSVEPPTT